MPVEIVLWITYNPAPHLGTNLVFH